MTDNPIDAHEPIRITLSPVMDRGAAARHLDELRSAFSGRAPIEICCQEIRQIGQVGLQLIGSALRTARNRGLSVSLSGSSAIEPIVRLSGLGELLDGFAAQAGGADQ